MKKIFQRECRFSGPPLPRNIEKNIYGVISAVNFSN